MFSRTSGRAAAAVASMLSAALTLLPATVSADDAELYQTAAFDFGPDYYANVLFVIDTSGSMENNVDGRTRLEVVQDVVTEFLNELEYVNVGLMRFDSGFTTGAFPQTFREGGGMVIHAIEDISTARDEIIAKVNALTASGTTQLSETMYEAASYLMGWDVYFGLDTYAGNYWQNARADTYSPSDPASRDGGVYISPIKECQTTHIVYLTDGEPQFDSEITDVVPTWPNFPAAACTDNPDWNWSVYSVDGDGDCLDDIAAYLYENDLYGTEADGHQNVITHTIGFFQDNDLLAETARRGGGKYYLANDADSLLTVLEQIFVDVNETGTTFTSPGVAVNAFDRTTHLDQLYYSVFQATGRARWAGNLKRYRLGEDLGGALVVLDADSVEAVDQNSGFFREDSRSWWSGLPDGASVAAGGAAGKLGVARNTLTEFGGAVISLDSSNLGLLDDYLASVFDLQLLDDVLDIDVDFDDSEVLASVLDWVHGRDVTDADGDGDTSEARKQLGDPMHSRPLVVTYGPGADEPEAIVFFGTNEGFLHAVRGSTGEEVSAFMPKELLGNLDELFEDAETINRVYGVDGPITAWTRDGGDGQVGPGDSVYIYFGLRRGGDWYYAMDYTDPYNPTLMWKISSSTPGFERLGQTWSPMVRTKVKTGTFGSTVDQDVLIFTGGYDVRQDNYSAYAPDSVGNAIYMVNALTGELVWSGSSANVTDTDTRAFFADMKSAMTGGVRAVDLDNDGFVDRMYTADLGGRLWRLDVHNPVEDGDRFHVTGGVLASVGGADSAAAADNRRFYYAPDVALGRAAGKDFFNITIASGYRAHPKDTALADHFYVIRDYFPFSRLGLSQDPAAEYLDYYGFTHDELSDLYALQSDPDVIVPGFKMPLVAAAGEKVLSETRIFQNKANFTSYLPQNDNTQGCYAALGSGQLYSIDLGSGGLAVEALDKPGIPPEIVYLFTEDPQNGYEPPICFGDYCTDPDPDGDDGDGDGDMADDVRPPSERDIGCIVGPESCEAAGTEVPVKTFWTQVETDQ